MAQKQTRRSISINRSFFERSRERASALGVPLSAYCEHALKRLDDDQTLSAADIVVSSLERRLEALRRLPRPPAPRGRAPDPLAPARQAALYRAQTGCSMQEAADKFGVSRQAVNQYTRKLRAEVG